MQLCSDGWWPQVSRCPLFTLPTPRTKMGEKNGHTYRGRSTKALGALLGAYVWRGSFLPATQDLEVSDSKILYLRHSCHKINYFKA